MSNFQFSGLFNGVVVDTSAGTYSPTIAPYNAALLPKLQGVSIAQFLSRGLGFKEHLVYPIGTEVLCLPRDANTCYILGIVSTPDFDNSVFSNRSNLASPDATYDESNTAKIGEVNTKLATFNAGRATDVFEGEYVIGNEFGVLLGLFQQLAVLKGSELSQVQCFLLDDLVRIISHNYEHYTAMGETRITHDGKSIICEVGATHLSGESMGTPQVNQFTEGALFEEVNESTNDGTPGFIKGTDREKLKAIERLKVFTGRLGDFIRAFIVRPDPDTQRAYDGLFTGRFDTGLADLYVGTDGRVAVRSTAAISIEKTNWIPVPTRIRTPEDPLGDDEEEIELRNKDPFIFDNSFKYKDNPIGYFLQLRDCNTYLLDKYSLQNFRTYEKDFAVSKGPEDNETTIEQINVIDPNTRTNQQDFVLRRAGIYLTDNGGIVMREAGGAAIVLEGGNIYLQPAKDLVVQPLRNVVVKAGQFISLAAKKDIDLSSTEGGMRVKTEKVQHLYAKEEGIIIQTDSDSNREPSPDEEAYKSFGGLLLKSKNGVFAYGKTIGMVSSDQLIHKSKNITLDTKEGSLNLKSDGQIGIIGQTTNILGKNSLNVISNGSVIVAGIGGTNLGVENKQVGLIPKPGTLGGPMNGTITPNIISGLTNALDKIETDRSLTPFDDNDKFEKIKFRYLSSEEYNLDDLEDFLPMTLAQQDAELLGVNELEAWEETEVEDTLPYPGKEKFDSFYITSELLNLDGKNNDLYSKEVDSITNQADRLKTTSLVNYKVRK